MIGLKRGSVELSPHQSTWEKNAQDTIALLKMLIGDIAIDVQHIGSTSIRGIHAKPIIDIVVGVKALDDIKVYINLLESKNIFFRGQDISGQLLFVMGDLNRDIRTHHIHIVEWDSVAWNNYINFRDYLNEFPTKAKVYDELKRQLAIEFADNREKYTNGKQETIDTLLNEAQIWKKKVK